MDNILEELGINTAEIEDTIIDRAARRIADNIGKDISDKLEARAEIIVNDKVNEVIEQVLTQTFQPVTTWGEAKGEPTTIRDMFEKEITKWWDTKVDGNGKITTSYGTKQSRASYFANEVIKNVVDAELRGELNKFVAQGKAKVKDAMASAVAQQIERYWK